MLVLSAAVYLCDPWHRRQLKASSRWQPFVATALFLIALCVPTVLWLDQRWGALVLLYGSAAEAVTGGFFLSRTRFEPFSADAESLVRPFLSVVAAVLLLAIATLTVLVEDSVLSV